MVRKSNQPQLNKKQKGNKNLVVTAGQVSGKSEALDNKVEALCKYLESFSTLSFYHQHHEPEILYQPSSSVGYPLIFVLRNAFNGNQCQRIIDFAESFSFERLEQRGTKKYAFRKQGRLSVSSERLAKIIAEKVKSVLPVEINNCFRFHSCSSNMRFYKYKEGDSFGKHIDESMEEKGGRTFFTILIYLNGGGGDVNDLQGGETKFYIPERGNGTFEIVFTPQEGSILLHGHGEQCLTHEAQMVIRGAKYVLRTDAIYVKK